MILNEGSLARLMGEEKKAQGYQVLLDRDALYIMAPSWAISCERPEIPPKILAKLVEHLGRIPTGDMCGLVRKDGLQTEMEATFRTNMARLQELAPYDGREIKMTPLRYKGSQIWQQEADMSVIRIRPELVSVIDYRKDMHTVCSTEGGMIAAYGAVSWACIFGLHSTTDRDSAQMEYLAGMQWV